MAEKQVNARLIVRKDTDINLKAANPVLLNGEEILVVYDDGTIGKQIGDGVTPYNGLSVTKYRAETDRDGNVITSTYATKTEVSGHVTKEELYTQTITTVLYNGLPYVTKQITNEGRSIVSTDDLGRTLTETFNDDLTECTVVFTDSDGVVLGSLVKTISEDGTTFTILSEDIYLPTPAGDAITIGNIDQALDSILTIQNTLIGGESS